jgi:aminopeptidase-like protein
MSKSTVLDTYAMDDQVGHRIYELASRIFPLCRSITGDGVRQTLDILAEHAPIEGRALPTGSPILDWTVPKEWRIRDAYIKNARGERVVDFRKCNLHVVAYSVPVHQTLAAGELRKFVTTLPDQPDVVPYRTSFHDERWGFCLSHRQWQAMEAEGGAYEVLIDSALEPGVMNWGECLLPGETSEEVLISTHICHPSLANDNCSGLALSAILAHELAKRSRRFSYRFVYVPATFGSIAWLATNADAVGRIRHGLVLSNVGDAGAPTYKRSRRGESAMDRSMVHVLRQSGADHRILDFFPYGYDERQYCSPGFNLPVGLFQRSQFGTFPEYHTSADNLDFIQPQFLASSFRLVVQALDILERDRRLLNLFQKGEPQLGRRGLYSAYGSGKDAMRRNLAMLWVLNMSDGSQSLLDIAERAKMTFDDIADAAGALERHGLVAACADSGGSGPAA